MLESADDKERRRLTVQLGASRALDDVQALRGILIARDGLVDARRATARPHQFADGPVLETVKAQLDHSGGGKSDLFLYSLVLVMSKLASPWQLIRLATKAANSDDAKRIAETPYAVAVQIVLEEVDRRVRELAADLKSGRGIAVAALLKEVHDALRGVTFRDRPVAGIGMGQAAQRAPRRRFQNSHRRDRVDARPGAAPDPAAAAQGNRAGRPARRRRSDRDRGADRLRRGVPQLCERACDQRGHAAHLHELQHFLETGTSTLLDALRGASPANARSASRRSMPRCGSAPRCSARNMRRCSPRPPKSPRRPRAQGRARA